MTKIYLNNISIRFNPRDIWVGVYWRSYNYPDYNNAKSRIERWISLSIYLCILPMFPICFKLSWLSKYMSDEILKEIYAKED